MIPHIRTLLDGKRAHLKFSHNVRACCAVWNDSATVTWIQEPSKQDLIAALARVGRLAPPFPANATCEAPALPGRPTCEGASAFTGAALQTPRRIAYMMQVGFEADTLEIALREVADVVDVVFLVESTRSHNPQGKEQRAGKPLLWEHLKATDRFHFLPRDKVVHVVVDDAETQVAAQANSTDIWSMEALQTMRGVDRVKKWANATGALRADDVLVSGDVDELLARPTLHQLRWCELGDTVVSSAIWMPMGRLDTAIQTDWPAPGMPRSLALPTVYEWGKVTAGRLSGGRVHNLAKIRPNGTWKTTRGGMHMTNPAFMPLVMVKELTATEYPGRQQWENMTLASLNEAQEDSYELKKYPQWRARMHDLEALPADELAWLPHVPWWLACNPRRFPYWYGKPEPRNAALLYVLQQVANNVSYDDVDACFEEHISRTKNTHVFAPHEGSLQRGA